MRAIEILTEMAFDKKVAEAKIRAKEEKINLHLVKLLAFTVDEGVKIFWRKEIYAETRFLSGISMRVGSKVRHVTSEKYFTLLYTEPFGQNEINYTKALIDVAETKAEQKNLPLIRNQRNATEIAKLIHQFYQSLCPLLEAGDGGKDILERVA